MKTFIRRKLIYTAVCFFKASTSTKTASYLIEMEMHMAIENWGKNSLNNLTHNARLKCLAVKEIYTHRQKAEERPIFLTFYVYVGLNYKEPLY